MRHESIILFIQKIYGRSQVHQLTTYLYDQLVTFRTRSASESFLLIVICAVVVGGGDGDGRRTVTVSEDNVINLYPTLDFIQIIFILLSICK